jgi:alpha-galactosidase
LGCNHPIWPSAGLIHGSRSSMDIQRDWRHVLKTGRENLLRGWQNGRLWWNDPDCLVLNHNGRRGLTEFDDRGFLFHATLMYATGGMLLTGDDMRTYGAIETSRLHKVYPPTGRCMEFADTQFRIGRLVREQDEIVAVFNWDEQPVSVDITLNHGRRIVDFWSDEDLGWHESKFSLTEMPGRSARLLKLTPERKRK